MSKTPTSNTSHASTIVTNHRARMTPPALEADPQPVCKPPELDKYYSNSPIKENLTDIILKDKFSC